MRNVMGINKRNVELIKPQSDRKLLAQVDDKLVTKEILKNANIKTAEIYDVCKSFFDIQRFLDNVNKKRSFVLKPSRGYGGNGIEIIRDVEDENWKMSGERIWEKNKQEDYLREILFGIYSMGDKADTAFAEELITPHEAIGVFSNDGLPDIRVIVHKGIPVASMIRVPTKKSKGKANLHSGGFAAAVDIATGDIQDGWFKNKRIKRHPETGETLSDHSIPYWEEILSISKKLIDYFELPYIGVDFTVDRFKGPLILELNARPGLEIQNVIGKGITDLLDGVI